MTGRGPPRPATARVRDAGDDAATPEVRADVATPDGALPDGRLSEWMGLHGAALRRHVARMLEHPDDADDVLQQVWLTAHESPPTDGPDGGVAVRAWLYRVATRAALDRLARERRRAGLLSRRAEEVAPDPAPSPDGALMDEALRERVRASVASLPRRQREAVWLRWLEGEAYATIARKLECSEAAARANVYQGLKRLRDELSDLWNEERNR